MLDRVQASNGTGYFSQAVSGVCKTESAIDRTDWRELKGDS